MRWFRRWSRFFMILIGVIILTFSLIFVIGSDSNNNEFKQEQTNNKVNEVKLVKLPQDHYYYYRNRNHDITSESVLSFASEIHINSFRPSHYLRRNSSLMMLPVNNWPSDVEFNRLLDIDNFDFLINSSHICMSKSSTTFGLLTTTRSKSIKSSFISKSPGSSSSSDELRQSPFLVALVHSSPLNFQKRAIIRKTWGSIKRVNGLRIEVVFIIGLVNDNQLQVQLNRENDKFNDLVQGLFYDSYYNLTYKHLTGYKWLMRHCNHTRFVMKVDDDAFIDIFRVVKILKDTFHTNYNNHNSNPNYNNHNSNPNYKNYNSNPNYKNYNSNPNANLNNNDYVEDDLPKDILACSVFPDGTLPKRKGKWSLTFEQYPFLTYPSYCSGVAYFLTPDVLYDIYQAAHKIQPVLRIDDVFLTGIVAAVLRLNHLPLNLRYTYQANKLRQWLYDPNQIRPNPYMVGDIGDIGGYDWENLMINLWKKTLKAWTTSTINNNIIIN